MSIEQQVTEVARVKRPESFVVRDLQVLAPHRTLRDAWELMARSEATSVLVVEHDDRLVGILTIRDLLFEDEPDKPVREVMTRGDQLITAPVGTITRTATSTPISAIGPCRSAADEYASAPTRHSSLTFSATSHAVA